MSRFALLALLAVPAALAAQPPQVSQADRQRVAALSAALAQCHHGVVLRDARTRLTAPQIVDRAIAACLPREAPIRAALVRQLGPERTAALMQAQRAHARQAILQMVAQARAAR